MTDSDMTKELLDKYYEGLRKKGDFGSILSDAFSLTGTVVKETIGREAYVNNNFFKGMLSLKIKSTIIEGDSACVIVNYDLMSPKGNKFSADVAEVWNVKNGKLDSAAIYFDTAYFQKAMA
jgi:ketosteroid isomerase-like protein